MQNSLVQNTKKASKILFGFFSKIELSKPIDKRKLGQKTRLQRGLIPLLGSD
jgi:hypothetical protein